jgi:hypothetical protein
MTPLQRWWRIFWAASLTLLVFAQPALADVLQLDLNDALKCTGGAAGTGATIFSNYGAGAAGCHSADMGFVTSFVCMFESTLGLVIATFFCNLAQAWIEPFAALILIFMFASGVAFMTGILPMTVKDFATMLFKVALIATFALNTEIALQVAFKLFIGIIKESVSIFAGVFDPGSVSMASQDGLVGDVNNTTPTAITVSTGDTMGCHGTGKWLAGYYAVMFILLMLLLFLPILGGLFVLAVLSVLNFVGRAAFGYLYALVMLTALVAAMPIFVSFALFSTTRQLFTSWLAYIFSNIVQIMIVFAFLGFAKEFDVMEVVRQVNTLVTVKEYNLPFDAFGWFPLTLCTICEPNLIWVDPSDKTKLLPPEYGGILEIAPMPNQCKVVNGHINAISPFELPLLKDLIGLLLIKAASLFLLGSVIGDFMRMVPEMSKQLGGSSPMMTIGGTSRSGGADNSSVLKVPLLHAALSNMQGAAEDHFTFAGWRKRNRGGIISSLLDRNRGLLSRVTKGKGGHFWQDLGEVGRSALYGRNTLNRLTIQALQRHQNEAINKANESIGKITAVTTALKKKMDDLTARKETLEQKKTELQKELKEKRKEYHEKIKNLSEKLGTEKEREELDKEYASLNTPHQRQVKESYGLFSDADKLEKAGDDRSVTLDKMLETLHKLQPGQSLTADQAADLHKTLDSLSKTGMEMSSTLLHADNHDAVRLNDGFITASAQLKNTLATLSKKKKGSAEDTLLVKKSLMHLKEEHAKLAVELRRHFEATQEKYLASTMERDRHKLEWLFEEMSRRDDRLDEHTKEALNNAVDKSYTDVMTARKQMEMHRSDLMKNESELGSTRLEHNNNETELKNAEDNKKRLEKDFKSGNYLRGRTDESRKVLDSPGIELSESRSGLLDEILNPDDEYERFFGDRRMRKYGDKKERYSWMSVMHSAD